MQIDILAIVSHPDDAELSCAGTLMLAKKKGQTTGIVDLTLGELGTRGTPEIRAQEAQNAARILELDVRESLDLGDGFFDQSRESLEEVIRVIRRYRPMVVLTNAVSDRHPDHARGSELVSRACFLAGLEKIATTDSGEAQSPWRPKEVFHVIQFRYMTPDFVVDIGEVFVRKMESIKAFRSQFYDPESKESPTLISSKKFLDYVESRAREFGASIEVEFGEGYVVERPLKVDDILSHI